MADQQFCLRWNNHQSTLISVFDTLLLNGTLVDCTLAAEGQYLKAHKVVLSACSPYLESLLSQHFEKHPIVILKDVKFSELKSMMDYMYRGEVNISQDQLGTFLKAAESLQIKGLSDNGADGDARDVGSTPKAPPPRKANVPAPSNRPEPVRPDSPLTDGSMSPSSRKRRRVRRSSQDDDNHLESNSCDLPSQAQSTPVPNIPASSSITTTPIVKPAIVKPEQTDVNRIDSNSLPLEVLKKEIEPISEPLIEPKTEYLEDVNNEDSVEDLTLDDDDDMEGMDISNMSNMSNMSRPGPSHGNDISNQSFTAWNLGANQSGTDEVFMAAQEAVNQHRDSQGLQKIPAPRSVPVFKGSNGRVFRVKLLELNKSKLKLGKIVKLNKETQPFKSTIDSARQQPLTDQKQNPVVGSEQEIAGPSIGNKPFEQKKALLKIRTDLFEEKSRSFPESRLADLHNSNESVKENLTDVEVIKKPDISTHMNNRGISQQVRNNSEIDTPILKESYIGIKVKKNPETSVQIMSEPDTGLNDMKIPDNDVQVSMQVINKPEINIQGKEKSVKALEVTQMPIGVKVIKMPSISLQVIKKSPIDDQVVDKSGGKSKPRKVLKLSNTFKADFAKPKVQVKPSAVFGVVPNQIIPTTAGTKPIVVRSKRILSKNDAKVNTVSEKINLPVKKIPRKQTLQGKKFFDLSLKKSPSSLPGTTASTSSQIKNQPRKYSQRKCPGGLSSNGTSVATPANKSQTETRSRRHNKNKYLLFTDEESESTNNEDLIPMQKNEKLNKSQADSPSKNPRRRSLPSENALKCSFLDTGNDRCKSKFFRSCEFCCQHFSSMREWTNHISTHHSNSSLFF